MPNVTFQLYLQVKSRKWVETSTMDVSGEMITEIKRKLYSKRSVDIYNACIDIRKKVIKTPRGIDRLVRDQVIPVLLGILKRTSDEQVIHQTINRFYQDL